MDYAALIHPTGTVEREAGIRQNKVELALGMV
jgi:hypothetical protein